MFTVRTRRGARERPAFAAACATSFCATRARHCHHPARSTFIMRLHQPRSSTWRRTALHDDFGRLPEVPDPAYRQSLDRIARRQYEVAHTRRRLARPKANVTIRALPGCGAVAQLGERLVRNEKVRSSILLGSTNFAA